MVGASEPVVIIGAGPYGVGLGAHLSFAGIPFRIFGTPMRRWLTQMPRSICLKSEACASSLPDPHGRFTLETYYREHGIPYTDIGTPVSREVFTNYALEFQKQFVSNVENFVVVSITKAASQFSVKLSTGEVVAASKVIVATGLDHMDYIPAPLRALPTALCSHAADHVDFGEFKGMRVGVIGAGQSGLEAAALLHEAGALPHLIVRAPSIIWGTYPSTEPRSAISRMWRAQTRLGRGRLNRLYDRAPLAFHHLPKGIRVSLFRRALGPAGAWWLRERVNGKVPTYLNHRLERVDLRGETIALRLAAADGLSSELVVDHVIAATGYEYHLKNLPFIDESLKSQIEYGMPVLSGHLKSMVGGLYFVGLASAISFGPAMRFVAGTGYAAQRICRHIAGRDLKCVNPPDCAGY